MAKYKEHSKSNSRVYPNDKFIKLFDRFRNLSKADNFRLFSRGLRNPYTDIHLTFDERPTIDKLIYIELDKREDNWPTFDKIDFQKDYFLDNKKGIKLEIIKATPEFEFNSKVPEQKHDSENEFQLKEITQEKVIDKKIALDKDEKISEQLKKNSVRKIISKNIPLQMLFSILTMGIYALFWQYQIHTESYKLANRKSKLSGFQVVLFNVLTLGIFGIFWSRFIGRVHCEYYKT